MVSTKSGAANCGLRTADCGMLATDPPALKIARSMPPHSASIRRAATATAAGSVTSAGTTSSEEPPLEWSLAIASSRSTRRAVMATRAPRSTSRVTSAAPMPLLAPVSQTRAARNEVRGSGFKVLGSSAVLGAGFLVRGWFVGSRVRGSGGPEPRTNPEPLNPEPRTASEPSTQHLEPWNLTRAAHPRRLANDPTRRA